jgi:hypothetical protein
LSFNAVIVGTNSLSSGLLSDGYKFRVKLNLKFMRKYIKQYFTILSLIGLFSVSFQINAQKSLVRPAYGHGEELHYVMSYGFITGGKGILTVRDSVLFGKKVHHMVGTAYTVGMTDAVYKIRDTYESFVDLKTDLPIKSIRNIREGRYRYYNEVLFNHGPDSTKIKSMKSGEKYVAKNILDIVSVFYLGRKIYFNDSLVKGQVIEFMTYFSDKEYPLRIRYKGIETIKTKFGNLECYKFSPVTEVGRSFKTDDDMHIWITRDKNRLPVRVKFDLTVGSFTCDLETFRGLQNPFSSFVP